MIDSDMKVISWFSLIFTWQKTLFFFSIIEKKEYKMIFLNGLDIWIIEMK
jgi:hypothetical protein